MESVYSISKPSLWGLQGRQIVLRIMLDNVWTWVSFFLPLLPGTIVLEAFVKVKGRGEHWNGPVVTRKPMLIFVTVGQVSAQGFLWQCSARGLCGGQNKNVWSHSCSEHQHWSITGQTEGKMKCPSAQNVQRGKRILWHCCNLWMCSLGESKAFLKDKLCYESVRDTSWVNAPPLWLRSNCYIAFLKRFFLNLTWL